MGISDWRGCGGCVSLPEVCCADHARDVCRRECCNIDETSTDFLIERCDIASCDIVEKLVLSNVGAS